MQKHITCGTWEHLNVSVKQYPTFKNCSNYLCIIVQYSIKQIFSLLSCKQLFRHCLLEKSRTEQTGGKWSTYIQFSNLGQMHWSKLTCNKDTINSTWLQHELKPCNKYYQHPLSFNTPTMKFSTGNTMDNSLSISEKSFHIIKHHI